MKSKPINLKEEIPLAQFVFSRARIMKPQGVTLIAWIESLVTEGVEIWKSGVKIMDFTQQVRGANVSLDVRNKCIELQPSGASLMQWCSTLVSLGLDAKTKKRNEQAN